MGDARLPFLANVIGHWAIGLPIAIWLGSFRGLGIVGYWWGLSAGLTTVAVGKLTIASRWAVMAQ